ncbi:putative methylesterase 6 [Arabidopsis thaliana]
MLRVRKAMENKNQKRFVLIHGVCHGAWTWDKVKTQLEVAGHCVTAVDLAASDDGKVIVVAHSMGGISAALAADSFACKIAAIVFLTAFMPDTINPPAYVYEKLLRSIPQEEWLDTTCVNYGKPDFPLQYTLLGPKFMAKKMYQNSPVQDLEVVKTLVRENPLVTNNLAGTRSFSEEGYGSVTRIYIVCREDLVEVEDYQRWMISNFPPKEVMEIKCADHMPMFSKPQEVCALLLEIANKYCKN